MGTLEPAHADTIYRGGPILTMTGERPVYADAVAVKDGMIAFVGPLAAAEALRGPKTKVRDLDGRSLLPGFIDAHSHFMFAVKMVNQVNVANPPVGPVSDVPSTIAALKAFQARAEIPEGGWIVGWGYDAEGLREGRHITRRDLDPHFPRHRVMLIHVSGHGAVLNSRALEFAGIDAATKAPAGAVINRF
jgi:predicted amidohydrolase YtcJ